MCVNQPTGILFDDDRRGSPTAAVSPYPPPPGRPCPSDINQHLLPYHDVRVYTQPHWLLMNACCACTTLMNVPTRPVPVHIPLWIRAMAVPTCPKWMALKVADWMREGKVCVTCGTVSTQHRPAERYDVQPHLCRGVQPDSSSTAPTSAPLPTSSTAHSVCPYVAAKCCREN